MDRTEATRQGRRASMWGRRMRVWWSGPMVLVLWSPAAAMPPANPAQHPSGDDPWSLALADRWSGEAVRTSRYRMEIVTNGTLQGLSETRQQTTFTMSRTPDGSLRIAANAPPQVKARVMNGTFQVPLLKTLYGVEPPVVVPPGDHRAEVSNTRALRQAEPAGLQHVRTTFAPFLHGSPEALDEMLTQVSAWLAPESLALDIAIRWQDLIITPGDPAAGPRGQPVIWLTRNATTHTSVEQVGRRLSRGPEPCPEPAEGALCDVIVVDIQWPEQQVQDDLHAGIRRVLGPAAADALRQLMADHMDDATPPVRMRQVTTWRDRPAGRPVASRSIDMFDLAGGHSSPSIQITRTTTHRLAWRDP